MKKVRKPTLEEWNSLYQAAVDFKLSACWEWMYDDDIFGVVDPESGETAYCCIMGNAGEHFADLLVDGPFELSQRNLLLRFRGSENQRIIDVQESLKHGKIVH